MVNRVTELRALRVLLSLKHQCSTGSLKEMSWKVVG